MHADSSKAYQTSQYNLQFLYICSMSYNHRIVKVDIRSHNEIEKVL